MNLQTVKCRVATSARRRHRTGGHLRPARVGRCPASPPINVTLRWIRTRAGTRHCLFDPAAIPALRTTLRARMAAIRAQRALVEQGVPVADAFPVRPSSLCAACPVAALCPAAAVYAPTALASWTAPPHPLTPDAPDPAATAVGEALLATEAAATLAKAQVRSCRGR